MINNNPHTLSLLQKLRIIHATRFRVTLPTHSDRRMVIQLWKDTALTATLTTDDLSTSPTVMLSAECRENRATFLTPVDALGIFPDHCLIRDRLCSRVRTLFCYIAGIPSRRVVPNPTNIQSSQLRLISSNFQKRNQVIRRCHLAESLAYSNNLPLKGRKINNYPAIIRGYTVVR